MYQSIINKDNSMIFVLDLTRIVDIYSNPIYYLKRMIECVKVIEMTHPGTFRYRFNGKSIEVLAKIPCDETKLISVFGRYGGQVKFFKILRDYLISLLSTKLKLSILPSFNYPIPIAIFKTGIAPYKDGYKSTYITHNFTPIDIIKQAKRPLFFPLYRLDMKFWAKQLNPDIIDYRKKPVIKDFKEVDYKIYPPCISEIMKLKDKPPKLRYLLMKYLLLVHKREEAKRVLLICLNDTERHNLEFGKQLERWTYVLNNLEYNMEPTCEQLKEEGICKECKKVTPFEIEELEWDEKN